MPDRLVTDRLVLRPLMASDADALHPIFADPVAMRYFADTHDTCAQTRRWVAGTLDASPEICREFVLSLDGAVIGKAGIWSSPELGFFLRRDRWGQGLMSEALEALIPHLFASMAIAEMRADVDPRNRSCLALLHRLGFVETHRAARTIRIGGAWCDSVFLRLPRPDTPA